MQEVKAKLKADRTQRSLMARFGEFVDSLAVAIAPVRGARRLAARRQLEAADLQFEKLRRKLDNSYDGAETALRGDRWMASRLSPDSEIEPDLVELRCRSRELVKDDSIGGAVDSRAANVVGTGLKPQARVKALEGVIDEDGARAFNRAAEVLYRRWNKKADHTRRRPMWLIQDLIERTVATDGECFLLFSDTAHAELPIPLAVQVLASDRVETPPGEVRNPRVRMGIEYDEAGRIVAYHVRKAHPYDTFSTSADAERFERIPAERMCHVFWQWFPEQSRGLPWMVRVLNRLRDAKDLDEAMVIACQVEACYSAFIKDAEGTQTPLAQATADANRTTADGKRINSLEPGTVRYLSKGQDITFAQPSRPGTSYGPFQEWNYRRAAAGMDTSYEMLVKKWDGISFAGGRLVLAEQRIGYRRKQQLMSDLALQPTWCRMLDEGVIIGELPVDPRLYQANRWLFQEHAWIPNAWPYVITPSEETRAKREKVDGNMGTLADAAGEEGYDLEELLDQRKIEIDMQRERGILPAAAPGTVDPNAPQPLNPDGTLPDGTNPADKLAGAAA